ncbi:MAG: hypothetical protein JWO69_1626 [Thermoleophilia bacterium]|jgi:hypothetical protein|nr:hypothetical protein [Thermoleophilia bacterium]
MSALASAGAPPRSALEVRLRGEKPVPPDDGWVHPEPDPQGPPTWFERNWHIIAPIGGAAILGGIGAKVARVPGLIVGGALGAVIGAVLSFGDVPQPTRS